jgi:hypothetical protein
MCEGTASRVSDRAPEEKLASLMLRELGSSVDKRALRLFIKAHWNKITKLAHEIHDAE